MLARTVAVGLALVFSSAALGQSGGLVLYENGSPDMGSSYAGAGARAQDAATAFSNPAGMTRLEENHLLLGVMTILTQFELGLDAPGTVSDPPGSLDGGGDLGQFAPGLGSFGVLSLTDDLKFGYAVTALAANGVEYDRSWVGRAFIIENQIIVANMQPTLAYRVNDWFSIGAGVNLLYMSLDQELLASNAIPSPTIEIDDADDFQVGGNFGVLFEPSERTRIGVTYRTEVEFNLDGDIDVAAPIDVGFDADMTFPQGFNVSLYHELNDQWAVLADAGWSEWSKFGRIPTTVGPIGVVQERDWDDTWRIGAGFQWRMTETWMLRGGFSYDSSPIDDDKLLPDIPVGEQYRFSIGAQHDFGHGKIFGISYTALYTPIDVDRVAIPNSTIVLDGEYDPSMIHMIGMTFSLTF